MGIKGLLIKILAIVGAVLVWFPVIMPFVASLAFLGRTPERPYNFDYLMPAELFPSALLGGILLVAAELLARLRGRIHRLLIFWGLGVAVVLLFGGQVLAVVSGLASGETEPAGAAWVLVLATLAVYSLGLLAAGVGALLLLRDLFAPRKAQLTQD